MRCFCPTEHRVDAPITFKADQVLTFGKLDILNCRLYIMIFSSCDGFIRMEAHYKPRVTCIFHVLYCSGVNCLLLA